MAFDSWHIPVLSDTGQDANSGYMDVAPNAESSDDEEL